MTPDEILAAIEAFVQLEPEIQKGIVSLVRLIHQRRRTEATVPKPTLAAPNAASSSGGF